MEVRLRVMDGIGNPWSSQRFAGRLPSYLSMHIIIHRKASGINLLNPDSPHSQSSLLHCLLYSFVKGQYSFVAYIRDFCIAVLVLCHFCIYCFTHGNNKVVY